MCIGSAGEPGFGAHTKRLPEEKLRAHPTPTLHVQVRMQAKQHTCSTFSTYVPTKDKILKFAELKQSFLSVNLFLMRSFTNNFSVMLFYSLELHFNVILYYLFQDNVCTYRIPLCSISLMLWFNLSRQYLKEAKVNKNKNLPAFIDDTNMIKSDLKSNATGDVEKNNSQSE
jgi:hypothetical protein